MSILIPEVSPAANRAIGNGSTLNYPYDFAIADSTEILVLMGDAVQVYGTHYNLTGIGSTNGGQVQFYFFPPEGIPITILRNQSISQLVNFLANSAYAPLTVGNSLAILTKISQMLDEKIARALKFKQSSTINTGVLPAPEEGKYLTWLDSSSGEIVNTSVPTSRSANATPDIASITDFGAIDGAANNYTALQAAASSGLPVYVPPGLWRTNQPIVFTYDYSGFYGVGRASQIMSTDNDSAVLTVVGGTSGIKLKHLRLNRSVPAIAGGNGINVVDNQSQCEIDGLYIINQHVGISLGPTDFSLVQNTIVINCYSHGVRILNTATDGPCQWSFDNLASLQNDGAGFFIASLPGPLQMNLGTFRNLTTFANSSFGLTALGQVAVPIQGFRLEGGFLGEDGNNEVSLDTFGSQHVIRDVFVEGAGTRTTGRTLTTPPSNVGNGVAIGTNNGIVSVDGCHSSANSGNGYTSGARTMFTSNVARNNGLALVTNQRNGILIIGGRALINGNTCTNETSASQVDGCRSLVDNVIVVGNDFSGNASLGFNLTVPLVNSIVANNG